MASAKTALHSILDALLQLIDGLILAQLYGLMLALEKAQDCQNYFHIQLRFGNRAEFRLTCVL